jgi:hypothetical protein
LSIGKSVFPPIRGSKSQAKRDKKDQPDQDSAIAIALDHYMSQFSAESKLRMVGSKAG